MSSGYNDDEDFPRGAGIIEERWPYDGPYGQYRTGEAAQAIERLVRYLTNATGKDAAMPYPSTGHSVIEGLSAAVGGLDRLLEQLGGFFERHAEGNPGLYDDRCDPAFPAGETAHSVAAQLAAARVALVGARTALTAAADHAGHLGNNDHAPGEVDR